MISKMLLTLESNVVDQTVVDESKNFSLEIDWETVVRTKHRYTGEEKRIQISYISLYDHLIMMNGSYYYVLHTLSYDPKHPFRQTDHGKLLNRMNQNQTS